MTGTPFVVAETPNGSFSVTGTVERLSGHPAEAGGTFKLSGEYENGHETFKFSGTVEFFEGGDYNAELMGEDGPVMDVDAEDIVSGVFLTLDEQGIVV